MSHEDYVPAPLSPDEAFDPAIVYDSLPRLFTATPPAPPTPLSTRTKKLGLALMLAGLAGLAVGQHRTARAEATRGWVETTAVISAAKLRARDGDYHLDLAYRYRAGPRERTGDRIALEPALSREAAYAYAYAERFRPGARVPAWFDPAEPGSVVLEQPNVAVPRAPTLIGMAFLVAGLPPFARQLFRHLRHRRALRRAAAV